MRTAPPRLAEWTLRRFVPPGWRGDVMLGDLHEEFDERARTRPWGVRLWYWREALALAARLTTTTWREAFNAGGGGSMEARFNEARSSVKRLGRSPGVSAAIVATVALAVGANAAIFGAVRPVVAPDLPFDQQERVVRVWERNDERGWLRSSASWHDARDWAAAAESFESLGVYTIWEGNLRTDLGAQRIRYALAEPAFFDVLGVAPALGRAFVPEEIGPDRGDVVVLSHGLWTSAFGADRNMLGRTIVLADRPLTVVGVMPASFRYPAPDVDAWKPFGMAPDDAGDRGSYWVSAIGRLRDGVTLEEAQAEMDGIGAALEDRYPETNRGFRPFLEPVSDVAVRSARSGIMLLWGAVGILLLVACANIATLLMARSEGRAQEMAVRASLGADRPRLLRQLLVESVVVSLVGGALGVVLAMPATRAVARLVQGRLAYGLSVEMDATVVAYSLLVTIVAGVGFGLAPALRTSRVADAAGATRSVSSRGTSRWGAGLVVAQTALAVVMLVGAGLLGRTLAGLQAVDQGFPLESAITFRVAPSQDGIPERAQAVVLLEAIRDRVATLPGVTAVGVANRLPQSGMWGSRWTALDRVGDPPLRAYARSVLPGYLEALGVPLVEGRYLRAEDGAASEAVGVVSREAARIYWPDGGAIGSVVTLDPDEPRAPRVRVVGVVGDVEEQGVGSGPAAVVYTPFAQSVFGHFGDWGMDFVARVEGDVAGVASRLRRAVAEVDPALPVFDMQTLSGRMGGLVDGPRALALLMGIFAAVTTLLAALGIYAVQAYAVSWRRAEIGVRLALGAERPRLVRGVMWRGVAVVAAGLLPGFLIVLLARGAVEGLLFEVGVVDPATYGAIVAVLLLVGAAASMVPARRAAGVEPVRALRGD